MRLVTLVRASRTANFFESSRQSGFVTFLSLSALLLLAVGAAAAPSPDGLWAEARASRVARLGQRSTAPANPRAFALDLDGLKARLASAPAVRTVPRGVPVFLPMPDGRFEQFEAFEGQIMERGLQKRAAERLNVKPTTLHEMMKRLKITAASLEP